MRSTAVLIALLFVVAGCRTMTGRSTGQYVDDTTTTTKVKTALATMKASSVTRVDVDTRQGTVFLTGVVDNETVRQQMIDTARKASDGKPVVANLMLTAQTPPPAASPSTAPSSTASGGAVSSSQPQVAAVTPQTGLNFSRLEPEVAVNGNQRFGAYDQNGKRVATLYTIQASRLQQGVPDLQARDRIDHISIYPHPGAAGGQYMVVLWHVDQGEAARLQQR
jgi:hypothetical protein